MQTSSHRVGTETHHRDKSLSPLGGATSHPGNAPSFYCDLKKDGQNNGELLCTGWMMHAV